MSDEKDFKQQTRDEIRRQGSSDTFRSLTRKWIEESANTKYSYHFEWLGRPIIQYPQDMIGTQQLLWEVKPDLVIETGIARGGSLIFYASMLELIAQCGGPENGMVLGIDIDIRNHNREAIHYVTQKLHTIKRHTQVIDLVVYFSRVAIEWGKLGTTQGWRIQKPVKQYY
jgi:cephalosporin hydroxylase